MCGRYAFILPPEAMSALFRTLNTLDYPPRYNITPTQPVIAICRARRPPHRRTLPLGVRPRLGQGPQGIPAADQRPRRVDGRKAGLP